MFHCIADGFKFWKNRTEEPSTYLPRFATPYVLATPNQIETAAYALLRFARSNATNKALPVLKWIISKQNELGGYLSTQVRAHFVLLTIQIAKSR